MTNFLKVTVSMRELQSKKETDATQNPADEELIHVCVLIHKAERW
jgi:hypothetical protein